MTDKEFVISIYPGARYTSWFNLHVKESGIEVIEDNQILFTLGWVFRLNTQPGWVFSHDEGKAWKNARKILEKDMLRKLES
jgi:hypothetical protein